MSAADHSGATKPVCKDCGSEDVTVDALVAWNVEAQFWEVASTYDHGFCNSCDREVRWLDWVTVDEAPAAPAADDAEHTRFATDYRVEWEIDALNATTPREAAQEAWDNVRRIDSTATVFTVRGRDGSVEVIDLSEGGAA